MMFFEKLCMICFFFSLNAMQNNVLPYANQIIRTGIENF